MPAFKSSTLRPARAPSRPTPRAGPRPSPLTPPGASHAGPRSPCAHGPLFTPPLPVAPGLRPCAHPHCSRAGDFPWAARMEAGAACPCPGPWGRPFSSSRPQWAMLCPLTQVHQRSLQAPEHFPRSLSHGARSARRWRGGSIKFLFPLRLCCSAPAGCVPGPAPRSAVYQKSRHVEWKPPLVTRPGPIPRDLMPARTGGDTLSISCERGAFQVPPLLFRFCLEENKNYLLRARHVCLEPGWEMPRPWRRSGRLARAGDCVLTAAGASRRAMLRALGRLGEATGSEWCSWQRV